MFTLVIGAAASGKSEYAENLILKSKYKKRVYIATMEPFDEECLKRIDKHRRMRAEKGFETVECYTGLSSVEVERGSAVLIECMSNLAANEKYSVNGAGDNAFRSVISGVEKVLQNCGDLVVVSNDVFCGGVDYEGDTLSYMKLLADINIYLAKKADAVCEIVCGRAFYYKGGAV